MGGKADPNSAPTLLAAGLLSKERAQPRGSDKGLLICRARERLCALPVGALAETMRPLPITPFARAPPFVPGLSVIRGGAVPVVDLGALLGGSGPPAPTRFVTMRVAQRLVALALEEVLGLRALSDESFRDLPPLLEGASGEAVAAVARLDGELLLVLNCGRLIPEVVWSNVPGAAA